jgi:hypothetical protein
MPEVSYCHSTKIPDWVMPCPLPPLRKKKTGTSILISKVRLIQAGTELPNLLADMQGLKDL